MNYLLYKTIQVAESENDIIYDSQMRGWKVDDQLFTDADGLTYTVSQIPGEAPSTPDPPKLVVPSQITMRQARLALHNAGLLSSVQSTIDSLPEPQKTTAQIEWEYSNTMQRSNPLILALSPALNLTSEQIDELFIQGATL